MSQAYQYTAGPRAHSPGPAQTATDGLRNSPAFGF